MIRDLKVFVTREELELSTDIRDFTTLIYVILKHESSEWFEVVYQERLRYAISNMEL